MEIAKLLPEPPIIYSNGFLSHVQPTIRVAETARQHRHGDSNMEELRVVGEEVGNRQLPTAGYLASLVAPAMLVAAH